MGSSCCVDSILPSSRRHQASAAVSSSNCGGDHSPPQMPDAGRRSSSTASDASSPVSAISRIGLPRLARAPLFEPRQLGLTSLARSDALGAHRTKRASRPSASANSRSQIHDGLRVGGHVLAGCARLRLRPQRVEHRRGRGIARDPENSRQHALGVAVENGMPMPARARAPESRPQSTGRCRAAPRALRSRLRNSPPCESHQSLGAGMQIARARVVPQAGPKVQHFIERRGRECLHRRKSLHEPLEIGNHSGNLSLLQHHLGHPHLVRGRILLPGQALAAVPLEPAQAADAANGSGCQLMDSLNPSIRSPGTPYFCRPRP
jgi:hypothetical protein